MHGERYKGQVRLIKCEQPWQDYIADTEAMKAKISSTSIPNYYVISDEETKYFLTEGNTSKMIDRGLVSGRVQFSEDLTNPVHLDSCLCFHTYRYSIRKKDSVGLHPFQSLHLTRTRQHLLMKTVPYVFLLHGIISLQTIRKLCGWNLSRYLTI